MKKILLINRLGIVREVPNKEKITLGRAPDNDIVFNEPYISEMVSRKHCEILINSNIWEDSYPRIRDKFSKNGTYVNDRRIIPENELCPLKDGDILRLGDSYRLEIKFK